jgi:phosphomannomutase
MPISDLKVSVSGIRAIVGDTLTPQLLLNFSRAFGTFVNSGKIVVGRDSRVSGEMVKYAVFAGLLSTGCEIIDIGICPVSTVHIMVKHLKAKGGIAITASHNPVDWNALKFINSEGIILSPDEINAVIDIYNSGKFKTVEQNNLKQIRIIDNAKDVHINLVLKNIDKKTISEKKFKVVVDCVNGGGSIIVPEFLKNLNCEVIALNTVPDGIFPHHPEPLDKNLSQIKEEVLKQNADIGFAVDADADRLGVVDDKGNFVGEEMTLVLASYFALPFYKTSLTTNLSSTSLLDWVAEKNGVKVFRSKVGEANVVEVMKKTNSKLAGEGGGKVIFPPVTVSADSISAMGLILSLLAKENKKLSEIISGFPVYHTIKYRLEIGNKNPYHILNQLKNKYKNENINLEDGIKIIRKDGWIHIRSSNTEPIIRIIVETISEEITGNYLNEILNNIKI